MDTPFGHTFGVRVHRVQRVQKVQRVVVAASPQVKKGAQLRRGLCRRVVKGRFRRFTGFKRFKGWWIALWAMLIKSALRIHLSVSYGMIGILLISRCAALPYPAAPDFPPIRGTESIALCFPVETWPHG